MIKDILKRKLKSFDDKGAAAIEFAFVVPIMVLLFFGVLELSDALSKNRKVNYAATMLTDLVSQEQYLTNAEAQGMFTAVEQVLEPYGITGASIWVASIMLDDDENPIVAWSLDDNLGQPLASGSAFEAVSNNDMALTGGARLIEPGSSLIVAKIDYAYSSPFSSVITDEITFSNHSTRWPRRTTRVIYCNNDGVCSDD